MLTSVRPIIDLIVAVDTGSSDKTISIIKDFGSSADIPTFVFERLFDNFCNSRNYAAERLEAVITELGWDPDQVWGLTIDCDEVLQISDRFDKSQFAADLYLVAFRQERESAIRRAIFRLSKGFRWENPVHEVIVWNDATVTVALMTGLFIRCEPKGASWKGNLEQKFLNYARLLGEYAADGHENCRTMHNIADSYRAAAEHCKSKTKAYEYRLMAKGYYERALSHATNRVQDRVIIFHHLAEIKILLQEEWPEIEELFLAAYTNDIRKAESLAEIALHYMKKKKWNIAYLFTSVGHREYSGKPPALDMTGGRMNISLYEWELLFYHSICCYFTGRINEFKILRKQLMKYVLSHINSFSIRELVLIQYNSPFYLFMRSWIRR